jgi:hypothetical protein
MGAFRRRVAWVALLAALAAGFALPWGGASAAAPNQLSSPTVSPRSGGTTTTFTFSVQYVGLYPATSVSALVGTRTIALSLSSGTAMNGTYTASTTLAAGTWSVSFTAVPTKRNSPTISGGAVTVAAPTPSPTPSVTAAPTAPPTPVPTAIPKTSAPAPAAPKATPVPVAPAPTAATSATPVPVAAMPGGSTGAEPSQGEAVAGITPGGADFVPSEFWPLMLGGFALIGLVIAWSVFAMDRDRRRRALAAEAALAAQRAALDNTAAAPERVPAVWELDARLEEAPIGTVEYLPLENGGAIGSLPEDLPEPEGPLRGNPRQARLTDARKHRYVEDRRGLLRRG